MGFFVTASALLLAFGVPHRLLPTTPHAATTEWLYLAAVFAVYTVTSWPFDLYGGYLLPCRHGRQCLMLPMFLWTCFRAALLQGAVVTVSALAVITAGRMAGTFGAIAAGALLMLLLIAAQRQIAFAVASFEAKAATSSPVVPQLAQWPEAARRVVIVRGHDSGFAGGLAGFPSREQILIPEHWLTQLPPAGLAAAILRRFGAIATGSRLRGVLVAMAWNLGGLALSSQAPGAGWGSLAEGITTFLWFNLWSFAGLLILPSISQRGVFELDDYARRQGAEESQLMGAASELDQLQDDEPRRPPLVERFFHPIPSVENRSARARSTQPAWGAWNAARMALFLSWVCFGFLARAVHCNSGRPELWVMLPAD